MTIYLLDINVLLALADPFHIHHEPAHRWFHDVGATRWATCAITANGFVRIASNPQYPNRPGSSGAVLELLRQFCLHPGHHYWRELPPLSDMVAPQFTFTHQQITDLYLLGLAVHYRGKLASFDRRITVSPVYGGAGAFELIPT